MKMKNYILIPVLCLMAISAQAQYRYAGRVTGVSREYNPYPESWCAAQILGAPNVYPQYDDIDGAWVAEDYGDQRDWISVGFDNNSPIDSIIIWETSAAGYVDSVFVKNPGTNKWNLVFSRKPGQIPKTADTMARILRIGFPMTSFNVNEVMIGLANDSASDWVELDAVAIRPQTLIPTTYSSYEGFVMQFDGKNDYYRTNYSSYNLVNKSKFTAICWVQVLADTAVKVSNAYNGAGVIFDTDYRSFGITHANLGTGDSLYVFVDYDNSGQMAIPYKKDIWQQIAVVNDGDSLKVYIDGLFYGKTKGTKYDSLDAFGIIEFGRNYDYDRYFNGRLDEVKFFNRALSASEILAQRKLIGSPASINGMVGYWQFNEGIDTFNWNKYTHLTDSLHNGAQYANAGFIVGIKNKEVKSISLYPNPNKGNFTVQLYENGSKEVSVSITDMLGREVYNNNTTTQNGAVVIETENLKKGVYFLHTTDSDSKGFVRFVID